MQSHLYHIQLNIDFINKEFYKSLMLFLGWEIIFETNDTIGYQSAQSGDIWFVDADLNEVQDFDAKGLNHIAIRASMQDELDQLIKYLADNKIEALFDTPKHRDEFVDSEDDTYYQVMFKSPDNILFEVVYIGVKG